jgi:hypothetical protein
MIPIDPITVCIIAAAVIGLVAGITITMIALVDRPRHWLVWIRMPEETYRSLRASAYSRAWSVKSEILHRLAKRGGDAS